MPTDAKPASPAATVQVTVDRLVTQVADMLAAAGLAPAAARAVAEPLVDADRSGLASHGVMLVPMYVQRLRAGSVSREREGRVVSDGGTTIVLDAGNAFGQLTAQQAVAIARDRARDHGIAIVAVRHAFHFGAAGYWAAQLARAGLVGIVMSNTRPLMPAPGGTERVAGNNPLAIAIPSAGEPIVFDMAASAGAMGKIRLAAKAGAPIPGDWATDARGNPTTDAAEAIKGMLLPAGGAKGFGLALVVDLLCGALAGGAIGDAVQPLYGDAGIPYDCSHCFIAIDTARFGEPSEFAARTAAYAQRIRSSPVVAGAPPVRVPGDRGLALRRNAADRCTLARETATALDEIATSLGLAARLVN